MNIEKITDMALNKVKTSKDNMITWEWEREHLENLPVPSKQTKEHMLWVNSRSPLRNKINAVLTDMGNAARFVNVHNKGMMLKDATEITETTIGIRKRKKKNTQVRTIRIYNGLLTSKNLPDTDRRRVRMALGKEVTSLPKKDQQHLLDVLSNSLRENGNNKQKYIG